ncbi:helix-turn-helix domain-containing protein [Leuconostoc mesenteroides]|uniref:helix-turn-helix domain-containing protein n=1 Tax=Leuconostoc mesenteroides TaxID=1245 RepID=UPI000775C44C|nr:helix-turn-helix transcriptional regulator [Leuconostoc mesenteroides]
MKFGDRLKKARTEMNLTQEQVANDFFITRQTISSWENEKTYPDIASLIKLSDYYHISLDTLLKEDSGMKEYLEKKSVEKSIIPMFIMLIIIDLLFITLLVLKIINIIQFSNNAVLILNTFGILNAIALLQLSFFKMKLGSKNKKLIANKKLSLSIGGILIVAGMLFLLFTNQNLISGILCGMGFAILVFYLFSKITSKRS